MNIVYWRWPSRGPPVTSNTRRNNIIEAHREKRGGGSLKSIFLDDATKGYTTGPFSFYPGHRYRVGSHDSLLRLFCNSIMALENDLINGLIVVGIGAGGMEGKRLCRPRCRGTSSPVFIVPGAMGVPLIHPRDESERVIGVVLLLLTEVFREIDA
jgi:hypothetical protein